MNVSIIADLITILTFVMCFSTIAIASVSKKSKEWLKSVFLECLRDYFRGNTSTNNTTKDNKKDKISQNNSDTYFAERNIQPTI